jgi:hypothetical protein
LGGIVDGIGLDRIRQEFGRVLEGFGGFIRVVEVIGLDQFHLTNSCQPLDLAGGELRLVLLREDLLEDSFLEGGGLWKVKVIQEILLFLFYYYYYHHQLLLPSVLNSVI